MDNLRPFYRFLTQTKSFSQLCPFSDENYIQVPTLQNFFKAVFPRRDPSWVGGPAPKSVIQNFFLSNFYVPQKKAKVLVV